MSESPTSDYAQVCARLDKQERLIRELFEQQREDLLAQLAARFPVDRNPPEVGCTRSGSYTALLTEPPEDRHQVMAFEAGLVDHSKDSDTSNGFSFRLWPKRPQKQLAQQASAFLESRDDKKATIIPRNRIQESLLQVERSYCFQAVACSVVVLNVIFMGVDIESRFKDKVQPGIGHRPWIHGVEVGFLCFFTMEMLFRFLAEQCAFFCGPNSKWNMFESFIVAMSLSEVLFSIGEGSAALRVVRVLRVARAVRVVRVFRFFHQLRFMLISLVSCFVSMFWALLLLLLMIYCFALYLEEVALAYLDDVGRQVLLNEDPKDHIAKAIKQSWNGMLSAVFSLIYSVSGGSDWKDLASPFMEVNVFHGCIYTLFVLFTTLGIFNILVGIFVQQTEKIGEWDKSLVIQQELMKMDSFQESLEGVFEVIDQDRDGVICFDELSKALQDKDVQAYLSHLEIDTTKVDVLFRLIDTDENGAISKDEFMTGFERLKGAAKPVEMVSLIKVGNSIMSKILSLEERMLGLLERRPNGAPANLSL